MPESVQHATNLLVANALTDSSSEGLKKESIEGYSREWKTNVEVMDSVRSILAEFLDEDIYL